MTHKFFLGFVVVVFMLWADAAHAATAWSTTAASGNWNTVGNWTVGVPDASDDTSFTTSTTLTTDIAGDKSVLGLTFSGGNNFIVNSSSGVLSVFANGIVVSGGNQTFNTAQVRPRETSTIANNGAGLLDFNTEMLFTTGASATITFGGSGNIDVQQYARRTNGMAVDVIKSGAGTLTILAANTTAATASAAGFINGPMQILGGTVSIGAEANLGGNMAAANPAGLTLNGGTLRATATFSIDDSNRGVTLGASGGTFDVTGADVLTVANVIAGGGTLTKTGTGTLTLSNANTYSGVTNVADGILIVNHAGSLGTTAGGTVVNNLGVNDEILRLGSGITVTGEALTLNSVLTGDHRSSLDNAAGAGAWNGSISLTGNGAAQLTVNGTSLSIGGPITGATSTLVVRGTGTGTFAAAATVNIGATLFSKTDGGTWQINSTGNDWGISQVAAGTLRNGVNDALDTGALLRLGQVGNANVGTYNLNGFNQTVAGLEIEAGSTATAASQTVTNTGGAASTLTINNATNFTYAGTITNGANALNLEKNGAGILFLNAANTYTGTTTLNTGELQVGTDTALGTGGFTINGGIVTPRLASRTLANNVTVGGDFTLGSAGVNNAITFTGTANLGGATRTITVVDITLDPDATFSGVISNGGLTKAGAGSLRLSGGSGNTYTGQTTVSAGTLSLSKSDNVDAIKGAGAQNIATPDVLVNGGTLKWLAHEQVNNTATISLSSGAVDLAGKTETIYAFKNSGGTFTTGLGGNLIGTGASITWSGGTNTINADGSTTDPHYDVSGGLNTVQGKAGPPVGVTNGGNLIVQTGGVGLDFTGAGTPNITLNADVDSPGRITLQGAAIVSVNAAYSGTGATISSSSAVNPGIIDLTTTNHAFNINDSAAAPVDLAISASIQGTGSLTKNNAGVLQLSGANTYTGATTVNAGTLQLVAPGSLQNSSISVAGGTFQQTGGTNNVTGTSAVDATPTGNLTVTGGGQYQLRGGSLNFGDYISTDSAWSPNDTSSINLTNGNQFEFTGGSLLNVSNIVVTGSTFTQDDTFGTSHFYVGQNGTGPAALTTINGGYSLLGGVLDLDVFGDDLTPEQCCDGTAGDNDQLTVLGDVLLESTVSLHFAPGYEPEFGDVFTLLCATGEIDYGPGFSIDGGFFRIIDTGNEQFPYALQAIVPEPASIAVWTLVGLAGAAAAWRMRRRNTRSAKSKG